jgi:hypothetical protein
MKIQGFRCLFRPQIPAEVLDGAQGLDAEPGVEVRFDRLSTLIGCNDAGKSSVLDALGLLLGTASPARADFYVDLVPSGELGVADDIQPIPIAEIAICAEFLLEGDRDTEALPYSVNRVLTIRVVYTTENVRKQYLGRLPQDERLAQDFSKLRALEQKELIESLQPGAADNLANASLRVDWLERVAALAPQTTTWAAMPRTLPQLLPRFERYSALDYSAPENIVLKTLRQVYESAIYEQSDGNGAASRQLIEPLRDLRDRVQDDVHGKVQELLEYVKRYNPGVRDISFDPSLDFSGALRTGQFQIDDGRGLRYLSKLGDGMKRRVLMAVMDWDRNVTLAQASESSLPSIIRGYDEPDTNLDYKRSVACTNLSWR